MRNCHFSKAFLIKTKGSNIIHLKLLLVLNVSFPEWEMTSACPHTLKSPSSHSLLEVRLWTVVPQLGCDGEVSPEGVSQVLDPLVIPLRPELLQPADEVWGPHPPVGETPPPPLPPAAGWLSLLCCCQRGQTQKSYVSTPGPSFQISWISQSQVHSCVMVCESLTYLKQAGLRGGDNGAARTPTRPACFQELSRKNTKGPVKKEFVLQAAGEICVNTGAERTSAECGAGM